MNERKGKGKSHGNNTRKPLTANQNYHHELPNIIEPEKFILDENSPQHLIYQSASSFWKHDKAR